jgi:predicted DNA-binding transcriptional regulator AlpA
MRSHHLDKRAGGIAAAAAGEDEDELLTTAQVAEWLGVSEPWLEIGRSKNWGPPFVKLTPRLVRYLRSAVLAWLHERTHRCTKEYTTKKPSTRASEARCESR